MRRREEKDLPLRIVLRLKLLRNRARQRVEDRSPWGRRYKDAKTTIWNLLEEPLSGSCAFIIACVLALCIVTTTVCFILESMPMFETPEMKRTFFMLEVFFVVIFSVEYLLRFWSTDQPRLKWALQPFNIIDLLAIIPFYISIVFASFRVWGLYLSWAGDWRILRMCRLLRMLKFSRWSKQLKFIGEGAMASKMFFMMLFFILIVGCLLFSTPLWLLERGTWDKEKRCYAREGETFWSGCSPFESVPMGMWWAITTLTTVGFGDAFALTPWGRVVNGFCMFAGIFCLAVPTTVLGVEFATAYHEQLKVTRQGKIMKNISCHSREELTLYSKVQKLEGIRKRIEIEFRRAHIISVARTPVGEAARKDMKAALESLKVLADTVNSGCNSARDLARSVTDGIVG